MLINFANVITCTIKMNVNFGLISSALQYLCIRETIIISY